MASEKQRRNGFDPGSVLTGYGPGQLRSRFAPGDSVYEQGDPGDAVYFIENGWIKMANVSGDGREAVVALRGPGEFVGARCLLDLPRSTTGTALTDCTAVRVTKPALIILLRSVPDFAEMFATYLVRQSLHDQENIVDHLTHSAEQRLARTLLRLANGNNGDSAIPTKISQALFAKMVGTTRSRVSFFMNRFKRQGFIEYGRDGRVRVHHSLRNAVGQDWLSPHSPGLA
jgi:CRP/FNR family transcriptional regulator, cyclic AMP receptor protein